MAILKKLVRSTKRYSKDTAGTMAMAWGVTLAGLTFSIGASYDLTQVSKAKAIAQVAADNMALAASIAVDFNNGDRFVEGQQYDYTYLGGPELDFTGSMVGSVEYDIVDDQDPANANLSEANKSRLLARATVSGTYDPAFMHIAPWISGVEFRAVSDVAYAQREGTPASILFVTDNSGSMGYYDDTGVQKLSSLKTSMNDFMIILNTINVHGERIFRTGLYPYSNNLITSKLVDPTWGSLNANKINNMYASGGTRSTAALTRAKTKFSLENDIHDAENGEDDPLKFLIFMSDGANNGSYLAQQCAEEDVWVEAGDAYWSTPWGNYSSQQWWFPYYSYYITYHPGQPAHWGTEEVCTSVRVSPENTSSLTQCTAMKNAGVKIYSVAYDVSEDERQLAEQFMKDCSSNTQSDGTYSDEGYYQYATSGSDLQTVFAAIGEAVVREVIRVKR